ncbi:MAG: hypothetical protein EHM17_13700 [Verrucomicrobiaceae bacterium]|nr:MAG: hypothetical protein EHM17_13700 [Verrucomicrobiaceae bacterium]
MKTSQRAALPAAILAAYACAASVCLAQGNSRIPLEPIGALSAFPTIVQTGTKPTLTWSILYPSRVSDLAIITPPGTITIDQNNTTVTVQPIGTGVTACDPTQGVEPLNVDARLSLNGSSYQQIFYGTQLNISPSWVLYSKKLNKGDKIDFGGRFVKFNQWSPLYTTRSANYQIIALVDGDTPPTSFQLHNSPMLANYLKPYLDASGKVNVGPLSILLLMELGQTNRNLDCFDYQDMALLVTFNGKTNNGHGNNLDGVDVSNPGGGGGGPNGEIDPSGGVDDER